MQHRHLNPDTHFIRNSCDLPLWPILPLTSELVLISLSLRQSGVIHSAQQAVPDLTSMSVHDCQSYAIKATVDTSLACTCRLLGPGSASGDCLLLTGRVDNTHQASLSGTFLQNWFHYSRDCLLAPSKRFRYKTVKATQR